MIFKPYYYFETGCAAYLFGCGSLGKCAVVDAHEEDIGAYIEFAASKAMRITHVIDTHIHADHRSGGPALAQSTGAAYCLHVSAAVNLPFEPLSDGQEFELGNTRIKVLHTPGHTPESINLIVTDLRRGTDPWFVLTGDTLFIGTVGRPDLPGRARENAGELYDSIHSKLLSLPGELEVYPGHFSGSACGAGMSGKPSSTLAFEKRNSPLLSKSRARSSSTCARPRSSLQGTSRARSTFLSTNSQLVRSHFRKTLWWSQCAVRAADARSSRPQSCGPSALNRLGLCAAGRKPGFSRNVHDEHDRHVALPRLRTIAIPRVGLGLMTESGSLADVYGGRHASARLASTLEPLRTGLCATGAAFLALAADKPGRRP